jgi:hypothetical protein
MGRNNHPLNKPNINPKNWFLILDLPFRKCDPEQIVIYTKQLFTTQVFQKPPYGFISSYLYY